MSLRRLLHVAMPLPDEPFDSWVEFMAHSYGATVGEMARALGLIGSDGLPAAGSQSSRARGPPRSNPSSSATSS